MAYLWMKNGMSGYLSTTEDMHNAAADGASIVRETEETGMTEILYTGGQWVVEQPDIDAERQSFVIVAPQYVDARMTAVIEVFDALAPSDPSTKTRSATTAQSTAFTEALARLKEVVHGDA